MSAMNRNIPIVHGSLFRVLHMENIGPSMICACGASLNFFLKSTGIVMRVQDFKILLASAYDRYR